MYLIVSTWETHCEALKVITPGKSLEQCLAHPLYPKYYLSFTEGNVFVCSELLELWLILNNNDKDFHLKDKDGKDKYTFYSINLLI